MNAKLGRQLRFIATLIAGSIVAGIIYAVARGAPTAIDILIAVTYAVEISGALIAIEMTLEAGAAGRWVSGLPFSVGILLRSLVYGAVILGFQYFDTASLITGRGLTLGLTPGDTVLLLLALLVSLVSFGTGRTTILTGLTHLVVFLAFVLLTAAP